ncbi:MAG TPA: hypothetical protein PLV92_16980 [Pirellulaceae bacterium]|nr:hypothetical protein [Pirellulaceae bacterium]
MAGGGLMTSFVSGPAMVAAAIQSTSPWGHPAALLAAESTDDSARLLDLLFGWLLLFPRDATLLLLAFGTTALITLARKLLTNQPLLAACRRDLARLRELQQEAKSRGDRDSVARQRQTIALLKLERLKADLIVLGATILPIGLAAWWAAERLEFLPLQPGRSFEIVAEYPFSSIGKLTHLAPPDGIELRGPAIQLVIADPDDETRGLAKWTCLPMANVEGDVELLVRHRGDSAAHHVRLGGRSYLPSTIDHTSGAVQRTRVPLSEFRPFGFVPGVPHLAMPPWLVGYLLLTLALVPLVKRLANVG